VNWGFFSNERFLRACLGRLLLRPRALLVLRNLFEGGSRRGQVSAAADLQRGGCGQHRRRAGSSAAGSSFLFRTASRGSIACLLLLLPACNLMWQRDRVTTSISGSVPLTTPDWNFALKGHLHGEYLVATAFKSRLVQYRDTEVTKEHWVIRNPIEKIGVLDAVYVGWVISPFVDTHHAIQAAKREDLRISGGIIGALYGIIMPYVFIHESTAGIKKSETISSSQEVLRERPDDDPPSGEVYLTLGDRLEQAELSGGEARFFVGNELKSGGASEAVLEWAGEQARVVIGGNP
jgi:hypothetical protein